jgi:hypothetical protein
MASPLENILECLGVTLEIIILSLALLIACLLGLDTNRIANAICAAARSV